MKLLKKYFASIGWKRFWVMLLGNVIMGLGVALFRKANMGTDPFNGMNIAVSALLPISYPAWQALLNIILLVIVFFTDKHYIGIGTIVNAMLLGYIVSFFTKILELIGVEPEQLPCRLVLVGCAMLTTSLGLALYQKSDAGCGPYDALPLIVDKKVLKKVPYFWCRMMFDAACAVVCFAAGGVLGLGTILTVFCLGPFVSFYNKKLIEPVLKL